MWYAKDVREYEVGITVASCNRDAASVARPIYLRRFSLNDARRWSFSQRRTRARFQSGSTIIWSRPEHLLREILRAIRSRPPHLNTWRDGRRSLLLLLACKPQVPFLYPG